MNKTPQKLGDILPAISKDSLTDKLVGANKRIIEAKVAQTGILSEKEFKQAIAVVVVVCGIKTLPDALAAGLCYQDYLEKYSKLVNGSEFRLAFQLNIMGDLPVKTEHYQVFSSEYMCTVLNQYIAKRSEANKELKQVEQPVKELPPPDMTLQILEQLKRDRKEWELNPDCDLTIGFPTADKLDLLNELFEVNASPERVIVLRVKAMPLILRALNRKLQEAKALKKFGKVVDLTNQLARLKLGHGLNDTDEAIIQAEVRKLLIHDVFEAYKEQEFIEWINQNLK